MVCWGSIFVPKRLHPLSRKMYVDCIPMSSKMYVDCIPIPISTKMYVYFTLNLSKGFPNTALHGFSSQTLRSQRKLRLISSHSTQARWHISHARTVETSSYIDGFPSKNQQGNVNVKKIQVIVL